MFQTKVVEKLETHIFCSVTFFFENGAVCEIIWKNTEQRAGHRRQYDICALHVGYLRLQTHSHDL